MLLKPQPISSLYGAGRPVYPAQEFFTEFSGGDENPLSEGSVWLNGLDDGTDWKNFQIVNGRGCGGDFSSSSPPPYNDSCALVKSSRYACPNDQFAEMEVYVSGGYGPSGTHELGLFVRAAMSSGTMRGYEAYLNIAGNFGIVEWNGPVSSFAYLSTTNHNGGPSAPSNGMVIRLEAQGTAIRYYQNGVLKASASDATWTSGQCGLQSYVVSGGTLGNYAANNFRCGGL